MALKPPDPKTVAGRAFVRSLNILLKFARLYGYEHNRTVEQIETAWRELRASFPDATQSGLLLAATGSQLLLDGVPLEGSPAEKQFAQLLTAAGLGSVQFFPNVTKEELTSFARAFPTGKAKPSELALQLKSALATAKGIRVNEICFVATDSRLKEASMAAQLAAASLGEQKDQFTKWLNDPQKLLELIAAAEGSNTEGSSGEATSTGSGGGGAGNGSGSSPTNSGVADPTAGTFLRQATDSIAMLSGSVQRESSASGGRGPSRGGSSIFGEDEIFGLLGALTSIGKVGAGGVDGMAAAGIFHEQLSELPGNAQDILKSAIAELAAQTSAAKPDQSVLVQLAEHLAIKYALERYERGEVKVNAVRQMLDRMNSEIDNLRQILGEHENKMTDAGMMVESHREILDRQFWAGVPPTGKSGVLLSDEAWCIPPRNILSYVHELVDRGSTAEATCILENYAACTDSEDAEARKKAAAGLSEMAETFGKVNPKLLGEGLRHLGLRLSVEQDAELQGMVSAAFVRFSQEAANVRCFPAMQQALDLIAGVETQRPGIARTLRSKMGIEDRLPDFIDEALRARKFADGLTGVLRLVPQSAMEQLAIRFNRCGLRDDAEHVASLAMDLGNVGVTSLRSTARGGPLTEAVEVVGLLTKLDSPSVETFLPARMKEFQRAAQDRIVRQISSSGASGRCGILLQLLDHVDPLVMPIVVDEIGVTGDRAALGRLLTMVDGDLPSGGANYLRVKAVEALGRIQAPESAATLKRIIESKKLIGWVHPHELRVSALQALQKLEPYWVAEFLPKGGIDKSELTLAPLDLVANCKFVRQRRHFRVRMAKPLVAFSANLKENCRLEIKTASLGGGVASINRHLPPGTHLQLKFQLGLRNLQAGALMRDYRAQDMAFEIVDMTLEERSKFRRLLADNLASAGISQDEETEAETPVETMVTR